MCAFKSAFSRQAGCLEEGGGLLKEQGEKEEEKKITGPVFALLF